MVLMNAENVTPPAVAKPFYKSLTVWFNVASLALGLVVGLSEYVPIPPEVVAMVVAAGNVLLRFKTNVGVTLK